MTNSKITCFRNADWIIGWDAQKASHCYFKGGDLAFCGDTIIHSSPQRFEGACNEEISGRGLCLMPGLIDMHNHSSSMPTYRGVREELGNPNFFFSGLYEGFGLFRAPVEDRGTATSLAICELLRSGVTTYVDMTYPYPGWVDTVKSSGIRAFISPLFDSAKTAAINDHAIEWKWSSDGGILDFENAMDVLSVVDSDSSGLLSPMMSPMSVDVCTPEILRRAYDMALERKWPFHIHGGQSVLEFQEMVRRTGLTSIQWLDKQKLLGPTTIIGHAMILDHHSWVHWHTKRDVDLLGQAGASISHCPVVFSRYGVILESFRRYKKAGINIGIGTDTHPHNMLEEMRAAITMGRIADQHMFAAMTSEIFDSATVGGARALLCDKIGRLASGALADIVVVDVTHPIMLPLYDPIRSLVFSACDRAVRDVYVGGRKVVSDGKVLTMDHQKIASDLSVVLDNVARDMPNRDRKHRTAVQVAPLTYQLNA